MANALHNIICLEAEWEYRKIVAATMKIVKMIATGSTQRNSV